MRMMNGLLFIVSLVGLSLVSQAALAVDHACAVTADHPLIGKTRWYGLYYEDDKIGHAVAATTLEERSEGGDQPMITQRFSMTFQLEQAEETITQIRRFAASPPHRLLGGVFESADRKIEYRQEGDDLHLGEDGMTRVRDGS